MNCTERALLGLTLGVLLRRKGERAHLRTLGILLLLLLLALRVLGQNAADGGRVVRHDGRAMRSESRGGGGRETVRALRWLSTSSRRNEPQAPRLE